MKAPCLAHEEGRRGLGHSGGRGHGWSELDEGRTTCFHLGVLETAAWRRKGTGLGRGDIGKEGRDAFSDSGRAE